jgi:hypothetical protein
MAIPISFSGIVSPDEPQIGYLIHNLWGYNFTLRICPSAVACADGFAKTFVHNVDFSAPNQTLDMPFTLDLFPAANFTGGRTTVECPIPTLITQALGVEPWCKDKGYPVRLQGPFQYFEVGEVTYQNIANDVVWIVFENFGALPRDYINVPQMYWASWKTSDAEKFIIAGGVVFGFGWGLTIGFRFAELLFGRA